MRSPEYTTVFFAEEENELTRNVSRIPKRGALGCEVSEYRPCIGVLGRPFDRRNRLGPREGYI